MLSLFPQILFLAPLAATLIRVALAVLLVYGGSQQVRQTGTRSRVWGFFTFVVAAALFAGLWTQGVALLTAGIFALTLFVPSFRTFPKSTVALAIVMALTLVVTGAGAFAFDLPL